MKGQTTKVGVSRISTFVSLGQKNMGISCLKNDNSNATGLPIESFIIAINVFELERAVLELRRSVIQHYRQPGSLILHHNITTHKLVFSPQLQIWPDFGLR